MVALKFAMSSHFPLPKIFSPSGFVPPLSNGTSRATSDRKPKTNDQILPSPFFLPIEKMNQINKRRGRPPKKRENPGEGYQSAIACHLAANRSCVEKYSDSDFKVLSHARNQSHLDVLEALYINVFDPVLCKQKLFVTNLTLFRNARTRNK